MGCLHPCIQDISVRKDYRMLVSFLVAQNLPLLKRAIIKSNKDRISNRVIRKEPNSVMNINRHPARLMKVPYHAGFIIASVEVHYLRLSICHLIRLIDIVDDKVVPVSNNYMLPKMKTILCTTCTDSQYPFGQGILT